MKFSPSTNPNHFETLFKQTTEGFELRSDVELVNHLKLLPEDTDFNHVDNDYNTVLYLAAANNRVLATEYLLNIRKVNPNVKVSDGLTAAHIAAHNGLTDVLKLVIQAESDLTIQDNFGETPLFRAIGNVPHQKLTDTISILLEKDTKAVAIANEDKIHPLELALVRNDLATIDILLAKGAKVTDRCYSQAGEMMVAESKPVAGGFLMFSKNLPGNEILCSCAKRIIDEYNYSHKPLSKGIK